MYVAGFSRRKDVFSSFPLQIGTNGSRIHGRSTIANKSSQTSVTIRTQGTNRIQFTRDKIRPYLIVCKGLFYVVQLCA